MNKIRAFLAPALLLPAVASAALNVFGSDDRTVVTAYTRSSPYNAVVRVDRKCTGTLVWKNLVLTAAHCLTNAREAVNGRLSGPVRKDVIVEAQVVDGKSSRKARIVDIYAVNIMAKGGTYQDWAIARLDRNLGDELGYFEVAAETLAGSKLDRMTLAGFSYLFQGKDITRGGSGRHLTTHEGCSIRRFFADGTFWHDCDSARGASGGSIFRCENGVCTVFGLNVGEARDDGEVSLILTEYEENHPNFAVNPSQFAGKIEELRREFPLGAESR